MVVESRHYSAYPGRPGDERAGRNALSIVRLLSVAPSTVLRWKSDEATPRERQEESLTLLYRTAVHAQVGNEEAVTMLKKFAVPVAAAQLLGLGLPGVLMAAGLGWVAGGLEDEK